MMKREVVFEACAAATPRFAAKIAQAAGRLASVISLEQEGSRLGVDSLISILSLDLRRGARVTVWAQGPDEAEAIERICALLRGDEN